MKKRLSFALLVLTGLSFFGCDSSSPSPGGTFSNGDMTFVLTMKGMANSATVGTFGVASTEAEAQAGQGTLVSGNVNWSETNGGKLGKTYLLPNRKSGEKLWVFLTSDKPLTAGQSLVVDEGGGHQLVLDSSTSPLVINSVTVGK